jgi:4-hydroxy-3-methylbut-2-enyl diphosphate reductase
MPSDKTVTLAQHAGFCFGVRRATDTLERLLTESGEGERIVTLGELIHNDIYNARMAARGVRTVEAEDIPALVASASEESPVTLLVRAHGIPRDVQRALADGAAQNPHFHYVDCTCPYVTRIHDIVAKHNAPDRQLWVFGAHDHPEVVGIVSCFDGESHVFASLDELTAGMASGQVSDVCKKMPIVVEQTTFFLAEWLKCQQFLKKVCTNA